MRLDVTERRRLGFFMKARPPHPCLSPGRREASGGEGKKEAPSVVIEPDRIVRPNNRTGRDASSDAGAIRDGATPIRAIGGRARHYRARWDSRPTSPVPLPARGSPPAPARSRRPYPAALQRDAFHSPFKRRMSV